MTGKDKVNLSTCFNMSELGKERISTRGGYRRPWCLLLACQPDWITTPRVLSRLVKPWNKLPDSEMMADSVRLEIRVHLQGSPSKLKRIAARIDRCGCSRQSWWSRPDTGLGCWWGSSPQWKWITSRSGAGTSWWAWRWTWSLSQRRSGISA